MIVTVIIPTYNRAEFLERAVASCLLQGDVAQFDILVVDDGSTDATPDVCARLAAAHSNVRVFRQENKGVAGARNLGLKNLLSETDVVTFLDSDDVFPKGRFEQDLPHFEASPALEMTYGRLLQVSAINPDTLEPAAGCECLNVRLTQLSSGLYRKELIERTGFFAEDMMQAEDTDFLYRIFEEGVTYLETDTVAIYYVRHDGNMTNDRGASNRYTKRAMLRSIKRRRDDPWRSMHMPALDATILMPNTDTPSKDDDSSS